MAVAPSKRAPKRLRHLAVASLAALTALAYGNAVQDALTYDDGVVAPLAQHPSWARIADLFEHDSWNGLGQPMTGLFRPLSMATVILEGFVHGGAPRWLHATAVGIHVAATLALFAALHAMLREARSVRPRAALAGAWAAALIFGVHPAHTDAVASYYNRAEPLVVLGTYAALWLLWTRAARSPRLAWGGALAIYLVSLLCKESAASMPLLLGLCLLLLRPDARPWRDRLRALWPLLLFAVPLFVYSRLRAHAVPWPSWAPSRWHVYTHAESWGARLSTVTSVLADGLRLLVWPHPLRCSYDEYVPHDIALATLLHAGLVVAAVRSVKRHPAVTVGVAMFYVSVLPSTSLFQDLSMFPGIFAERHLYLPSAALALPLGFALASLASRRGPRAPVLAAAAVALVFVPLTRARNVDWSSNLALFEADWRTDPDNGRNASLLVRNYLALRRRGDALAVCDRFLAAHPGHVGMLDACAITYQQGGRLADAMRLLQRAWDESHNARAAMSLGRLQLQAGDRDAAEVSFTNAVNATENTVTKHVREGERILRLHPERAADARAEFAAALVLEPTSEPAQDWLRQADRALATPR